MMEEVTLSNTKKTQCSVRVRAAIKRYKANPKSFLKLTKEEFIDDVSKAGSTH